MRNAERTLVLKDNSGTIIRFSHRVFWDGLLLIFDLGQTRNGAFLSISERGLALFDLKCDGIELKSEYGHGFSLLDPSHEIQESFSGRLRQRFESK